MYYSLCCSQSFNQCLFLNLLTSFLLLFIVNLILKVCQQNKTVFIIIIEAYLQMTEVNLLASTLKKEQNQALNDQQQIKNNRNNREIDKFVEKQNNKIIASQNKLNEQNSPLVKKNQKQDSTFFSTDAKAAKGFSQTERKHKQSRKKVEQKSKQNLKDIQEERKQVEQQLKRLDQQIKQINYKHQKLSKQKQKQKQRIQQQALKNAKSLVHHYKVQKKLQRQKRRHDREKSMQEFKKIQGGFKNLHKQQQKEAKQQKRRVITLRIQQVKKKQEERIIIDHQRNKVINKIIKQQQILKQIQKLPQVIAELEEKKAQLYQKKDQFNIKQIEEHQRKYMERKQLQKSQVISRKTVSLSHPIPKFKKNIWAQRLQAQQERKKSQQKQKQLSKKLNLQQKMKYSELVKSIFLPKKRQRLMTEGQVARNAATPDIFHNNSINLPTISQSQKRINDTKLMKKFRQNNKIKIQVNQKSSQKPQSSRNVQIQKSIDQIQSEKKRVERLIELKQATQERLKKIEEKRHEKLLQFEKKPKPIYKNYLGSFKLKRKSNPKDWKKIIESNQLSNQQKYVQMMKKVTQLQNQAQQNQYKQKQGKQISVDLYIHSIQAKLALLQKF